jgi:dTDP-4-dehydrorhamnose 3,5-epimerase-like enzyme
MKTLSPKVWHTSDLPAAWEHAKANNEPVFVPAQLFTDDRGWSMMNQMQGVMGPQGQINFSVQYTGVVKGWHRHALQTDFWICLQGHIKVGVFRETDNVAWLLVIGEKRPGVMVIPPPLWHGAATCGDTPAGLLYYVSHAYNPQKPDEDRRAHDSVVGFPWGVRHG